MRTHSGIIKANKKEIAQMLTALKHAKRDASYGLGGSYCGNSEESPREEKKALKTLEQGKEGLDLLEWIVRTL